MLTLFQNLSILKCNYVSAVSALPTCFCFPCLCSLRAELRLPSAAALWRRDGEQSPLRRRGFLLLPHGLPAAGPQRAHLPQCQHPLLEWQGTALLR